MWWERGYELYYETTNPPWYDCKPVDRVLGLAPLIQMYGNEHGTIPEWAKSCRDDCFPWGEAHGADVNPAGSSSQSRKRRRGQDNVAAPRRAPKEGSKTYLLNRLALMFSR